MTRPEERSAEFLRGFARALALTVRSKNGRGSIARTMLFAGITLDDLRNAGCAPSDIEAIESMTTEIGARQSRLNKLRAAHGLWDEEVVSRAQRGTLPPGPDFVEWLSLLRRDNLIKGASRRWKPA